MRLTPGHLKSQWENGSKICWMDAVFCDRELFCSSFKEKKKSLCSFCLSLAIKIISKCSKSRGPSMSLKKSYDLEKNRLFSLKMNGIKLN